ncbi:MAG: ABC transporter ATP-binding protein [Tissierellia bacterium]|nr:ABC transporter ATP-binding protein [Tissierellia bacterium]
MNKKQNILKRLMKYMGKRKVFIPISLAFSGISSILSAIPYLLIWIFLRKILEQQANFKSLNISIYAIWIGISAILAVVMYFLATVCSHLAAIRVEVGMQKKGMERLIDKPLGFFNNIESGKLRKIINEGASTTHIFLAHQLPDLSGSTFSLVFIVISMFIVDWRMGLASMIPLIIGMVIMMSMMGEMSDEYLKERTKAMDDLSNEAIEYVRGIPVLKTFGGSVFSFEKFHDNIIRYKDFAIKYVNLWKNKNSFLIIILQSATIFLAPLVIFLLTKADSISLLISNYIFYLIVLPNFIMIITRSAMFKSYSQVAELAIDRMEDILNSYEMKYPEKSEPIKNYDLEFKDVVFSYPGTEINAVDGISFTVSEGERVALVGASGSGKTTIARLAARFWDVKSGEILIGGQNIKNISKEDLMDNIAFVFQNTSLFSKSIKDNIIIGNKDADMEKIEKAIDLSMSRKIIDNLEDGLDTIIGVKGTYLSGGEKQRISLARAILKDAPFVILDEATAFVDPESEDMMQIGLKKLSKNKTTLMIAHRLSSVKDVDKILVISEGKIAEQGKHDELIKMDGIYANMYKEYEKSISWKLKS